MAARSQAARSNSLSMNRFCWRTSSSLTHRPLPPADNVYSLTSAIVRRTAWNWLKLCLALCAPQNYPRDKCRKSWRFRSALAVCYFQFLADLHCV
jgi:hypothetical protein